MIMRIAFAMRVVRKTDGLLDRVNRRHRVLIFFARTDSDDLFDRQHHDLAVSDFAGVCAQKDGVDRRFHEVIRHADLEPHLFRERHLHAGTAVVLDLLDLAAVALHAADREASNIGVKQRLEDITELLRANHSDDELHNPPRLWTATLSTAFMAMAPSRGFTR